MDCWEMQLIKQSFLFSLYRDNYVPSELSNYELYPFLNVKNDARGAGECDITCSQAWVHWQSTTLFFYRSSVSRKNHT